MGIRRLVKQFKNERKRKGTIASLRNMITEALGIKEQLDALYYFMCQMHTPSELGPAKDANLRIMQECDAIMLSVFHKFCRKHALTYWLDYGTLLGSIRHNGFIPWDDDMDIAMPRKDFIRAQRLIEEELVPLGFALRESKICMKYELSYRHDETGTFLDIFPVDTLETHSTLPMIQSDLEIKINKYRNFWKRHNSNKDSIFFEVKRKEIINDNFVPGDNIVFFHGPEFEYIKNVIHDYNTVMPLNTHLFEGFEMNIPNDFDKYLKNIYGENYMNFPRGGVLHHNEGRPPLYEWAIIHHVDMKQIKNNLQDIFNNL